METEERKGRCVGGVCGGKESVRLLMLGPHSSVALPYLNVQVEAQAAGSLQRTSKDGAV